jgi:hypothetical protein
MSQTEMPFILNEYRVWASETTGGYVVIKAEDQDQARDKVDELLNEYGLETLLYPEYYGKDKRDKERLQQDMETSNVKGGKHTQGDREILEVEEIRL